MAQGKLESITKMMRQGQSTYHINFDNEKNKHPEVSAKAFDDLAYCIVKQPANLYPLGFYDTVLSSCELGAEKPTPEEYKSIAGFLEALILHADKFSDSGINKILGRLRTIFGVDFWSQLPSPNKSISFAMHLFQLSLKNNQSEVYRILFEFARFNEQDTATIGPLLLQANNHQFAFLLKHDRRRTVDQNVLQPLLLKAIGSKNSSLDIFVVHIIKQYGYPQFNDEHTVDWCDARFSMVAAMINSGEFLPGLANILMPAGKYDWFQQFAKLIGAQHQAYFDNNSSLLRAYTLNFWGVADNAEFLALFAPPDIDDQLSAIVHVIDARTQMRFSLSDQNSLLVEPVVNAPRGFSVDQQTAQQNIVGIAANPNFKPQLAKKIDGGFTPLMALVINGATDAACEIVRHYDKEALLAVDASGNTAFHLASFYRDNKVIDALFKRAIEIGLPVEQIVEHKNARGFTVQQCYWSESSVHLKAQYQHARIVHLRDITFDRNTCFNRKTLNFQELKLFDDFLLADLMLNNNAEHGYPLQHCVRRREPKPSRNKHIAKLNDDQNIELDFTQQHFADFSPLPSSQSNNEQSAFDAFWQTEYGGYLQHNFFDKMVKFGAKQNKRVQEHFAKIRAEFEKIIIDKVSDSGEQIDDNTLLMINNALRNRLSQVMDQDWVREPANKAKQFFERLGKVLLAALLLFIPLLVPRYRYFLADTSQKHLLRNIDRGIRDFTQKNLLNAR